MEMEKFIGILKQPDRCEADIKKMELFLDSFFGSSFTRFKGVYDSNKRQKVRPHADPPTTTHLTSLDPSLDDLPAVPARTQHRHGGHLLYLLLLLAPGESAIIGERAE